MLKVFTAFFSSNSFEFARLLRNTLKYWFSFLGREPRPCLSSKICPLTSMLGRHPPLPAGPRRLRSLGPFHLCWNVLHYVDHNVVVLCLSLSVSGIHDIINITV